MRGVLLNKGTQGKGQMVSLTKWGSVIGSGRGDRVGTQSRSQEYSKEGCPLPHSPPCHEVYLKYRIPGTRQTISFLSEHIGYIMKEDPEPGLPEKQTLREMSMEIMVSRAEKGGVPVAHPHQKVQGGGRELGMGGGGHWGDVTV